MGRALVIALICGLGCGAELGGGASGIDGGGGNGDGGGGGNGDGGGGGNADAAIDAPTCANGRVIYLNFEGVTLTAATLSDATLNRASWMTNGVTTATTPPFRAGAGTRLTDITQITDGVRQLLSTFPVTVVTTRPAAGPYVMIVFGGTAANVGSNYGFAVNELDCDDSELSDVAWISDANGASSQHLINTTVGAIGFGLGLTATLDPLDCMCGWANGCTSNNAMSCTLSNNITRDPNAQQRCLGAAATQNERAAFSQAFCE